jgi:tRNA pseudouridine55 synthase
MTPYHPRASGGSSVSGDSKPGAWPSGLVIVDKPGGMTSHDVVARVRRLANTRRVGHAGTLDPMATGVLVIGIEKATRLLGHLMLTEKTYAATIRLGQSTTTDDAEGEPVGGSTAAGISGRALNDEIARLTGDIFQVPSSVSAIKVNGQRAYKLTRAGEAPELAARPVTVYEFLVLGVSTVGDFLDVDAVIRCSSGTYIRALARDLGNALGTGGHLTALRRTAVGPYTLAQARTLDELADHHHGPDAAAIPNAVAASRADGDAAVPAVIPLADAAAAAFPRLDLTGDEARRLAQGARLPLPAGSLMLSSASIGPKSANEPPGEEAPIAAFAPDGTLVALVAAEAGRLRSLAVFADATAFTFPPPCAADQSPMMRRIRTQLSRTGPQSRSLVAAL